MSASSMGEMVKVDKRTSSALGEIPTYAWPFDIDEASRVSPYRFLY